MSGVALADWWPVARGQGVPMRRTGSEDELARLPAHAGLWLDRMLAEPRSKAAQEWTGRLQLYRVAEKALAPGASPAGDPPALESYRQVFEAWREALECREPGIERRFLRFEAKSRILLHPSSNSTVTEGGILLHHTYGVPYLPGSAIKGVLRSRLDRLSAAEDEASRRLRDLTGEILGCLARGGEGPAGRAEASETAAESEEEDSGLASLVDFHDALWIPQAADGAPAGWSPLAVDIVNPHHPEYYTGGEHGRRPPSDTDEPTPVHRLSVAPRARFLVVAEASDAAGLAPWLDWLLDEVLVAALAEDGIGAWTSAGYGRLKRLPEQQGRSNTGPPERPREARQSAPAPADEWCSGRLYYEPGSGEITAALADGRRAKALRAQAQELLASAAPALRAALTDKRKREATAEVKVRPEGLGWRLVALRLPGEEA